MNTNNAGQIVISIFNIEIECFPKLTAINDMIFLFLGQNYTKSQGFV